MDIETLNAITREVERAEAKHPHWPSNLVVAAAIVAEESGELIRAALQYAYEGKPGLDEIKKEAIQTAAMCVRLLENL